MCDKLEETLDRLVSEFRHEFCRYPGVSCQSYGISITYQYLCFHDSLNSRWQRQEKAIVGREETECLNEYPQHSFKPVFPSMDPVVVAKNVLINA